MTNGLAEKQNEQLWYRSLLFASTFPGVKSSHTPCPCTRSYAQFKHGVADRGSSIRIPLPVQLKVRACAQLKQPKSPLTFLDSSS
jgi:hypothetical protein